MSHEPEQEDEVDEVLSYLIIRDEFDKSLRDRMIGRAIGVNELNAELWKEACKKVHDDLF